MDPDTERSIVEALRRGDAAAFETVYSTHRARLFSFLLRLSRSRTVAEDLLDETWLRLVRKAETLRPETRLSAWLITVARNLYWNHRRSCIQEETVDAGMLTLGTSPASWPSPYDLAAAEELEVRVERALADLPASYREVLLLVGIEGLSPGEAAAVCGVSSDALRQRLLRARTALRAALEPARPVITATVGRRYEI